MLIHEKMVAIMKEMPHIGKTKDNKQQGFKFRGIDDVMNVMKPLLEKHGVFILPETVSFNDKGDTVSKNGVVMHRTVVCIKYTFVAEDGSSVSCSSYGEGMDMGDKSTSKAEAIAMKYALFQTFCIPTEEMANMDPDNECPQDEDGLHICDSCGKPVANIKTNKGNIVTAADIVERSRKAYGKVLCYTCASLVAKKMEETKNDTDGR